MSKFICKVCGYIHEDLTAPEICPVCMASASEFSEIDDVSQIDNEPTEDDVEVKSETVEDKKDESRDESDKDSFEPKKFNYPTNDNPDIHSNDNDSTVSNEDDMDSDEAGIVNLYKETESVLQVIKWYKETYQVGLKEAKDRVDYVLEKHGLRSVDKSGSGCMVTVLVAISSTLSVFFLL